jgi:uncharacterized membrane protein YhaH (DUF805 family)
MLLNKNKYLQILYKLFFKDLFSCKKRSNRKDFVCRFLLVPTAVLMCQTYPIYVDYISNIYILIIYVFIFAILPWVLILQYFPLAIRRLHDLNISGWWILISFIPSGQLIILWLMFKKGSSGTNKYGEPPSY